MALRTVLDIINAACAEIGEEAIEDLDDETMGAAAASSIFESVVDFNLSLAPFSFAIELRQLSQLANATPLSGFDYVYDVPGEFLGPPRWLTDDITDPDRRFTRYLLTAGKVHSSADPLHAAVKYRPSPHLWPPAFRKTAITGISAHLALALASDRNTHDTLLVRAYGTPTENFRGGEMRAALNEDAQATPPRKVGWDNNPLTNAWRS